MSKLDVEFELTGLKFKISGERDDVSGALAKIQQQIAMLSNSAAFAANALDGKSVAISGSDTSQTFSPAIESAQRELSPGRLAKSRRGSNGTRKTVEPIEFKHDAEKYGFPKQEWNTANKAMWLLYVLEKETEHTEVSAGVLAATFKKYFKNFGAILAPNVTRDLGNAKTKNAYVSSDAGCAPETWFLLEAGKSAMEVLMNDSAPVGTLEGE